jgi:4-oxalocrotonate tautomerase family enzyme
MVTKKPKGLGMGLEALLGPKVSDTPAAAPRDDGAPSTLKLGALQPGKYQPRTRMDEGSLYELAESIKSQGVMQPVLVRPVGAAGEGRYEIIAGERRVRAARLAGLTEIPVLVKPVPDEAAAVMALIENIQREDLNPLEEAQGLKRLIDEFKLTHEQAAQAVGRSRSAASNLLRLLNLAAPVQQMLIAGDLEMGHARAAGARCGRADHGRQRGGAEKALGARRRAPRRPARRQRPADAAAARQAGEVARHRAPRRGPGRPAHRVGRDPRPAQNETRRAGRDRDRIFIARRVERAARQARRGRALTMPVVTVRIARRATPTTAEQKTALIAGITDVVQAVLDKRRESVTVIIDEVDADNWGEGGVAVTALRASRGKPA